jgi:hypothetical protein
MSGLSSLKLVTSKRQAGNDPKLHRRQKLCNKITEQILLAKAHQSGSTYTPTRIKTVRDVETGESRSVETSKRIKAWWWASDNGKLCLAVKYGAKTIEIQKGKNAIEANSISEVISTLEIIKGAVDSGELDAQIEALSGQVKQGFKRETLTLKK